VLPLAFPGAIAAAALAAAAGVTQPRALANQVPELWRGDANSSGDVDISDAISILGFLFRGSAPPLCAPLADVNASGDVDVSDPIALLSFLFRGSAAPPPLSNAEAAGCERVRALRCGEEAFHSPDPRGNAYACSLCHGTEPAWIVFERDPLRPGHGLGDAARRPSYFNSQVLDLAAAVSRCREDWMTAGVPFPADDQRVRDLVVYLGALSTGNDPAPALTIDPVPPAASGPSTGDAAAGCEIFARACETCHGRLGAGNDPLGPALWNASLTPDRVREHVRLSGPTPATAPGTLYSGLLGNRMPFFSRSRLGDVELEHVVAYVMAIQDETRRACGRVDSELRILRAGPLRTFDHGVRGQAEHWSDRTIVLRDFSYDGQGPPEVLVWVYFKTDEVDAILSGRAISPHLARDTPYIGETLEFRIPDDVTDAMFNTVAIWCTFYEQNYGEAFLFD
jgi:mono/diheme cytochrome c family protein